MEWTFIVLTFRPIKVPCSTATKTFAQPTLLTPCNQGEVDVGVLVWHVLKLARPTQSSRQATPTRALR